MLSLAGVGALAAKDVSKLDWDSSSEEMEDTEGGGNGVCPVEERVGDEVLLAGDHGLGSPFHEFSMASDETLLPLAASCCGAGRARSCTRINQLDARILTRNPFAIRIRLVKRCKIPR